jgi:hypothetical protein
MTAALIIDYLVTADMGDGQALPPYIDSDCAVWRVVCRMPASPTAAARTRWRRVRLSEEQTTDAPTAQIAITGSASRFSSNSGRPIPGEIAGRCDRQAAPPATECRMSPKVIARRLRQELEQLRARYDAGAVMPGIYRVIRGLEIELAWLERRP